MNDTPSHSPHQYQHHLPYSNLEPQKCADFELKSKSVDISQPSFLNCYICYKNIIKEEQNPSIIILECRHTFHPHCLEQIFTRQINSNSFPISCPLADCQQEPPMFLLSTILPHNKFQACLQYEKSLCPSIKQNQLTWTSQLPKETTKKEQQISPRSQHDTSSYHNSSNSNPILLQNHNLNISSSSDNQNLLQQKIIHNSKNNNNNNISPVDIQPILQSNFYVHNTYQQKDQESLPAGYQLPEIYQFDKRRMSHEYNKSHSFAISPAQRSTSRSSKQNLNRNYSNRSNYKNISVINESSQEQQTTTSNKQDQFLSAIRKYANRKLQMQPQMSPSPGGSKKRVWNNNNNSPKSVIAFQKTHQILNNSVGFDGYNPERGFSQKRFLDINSNKGNNNNINSRKNSNHMINNSNKSINLSNHNNSVDSHSKFMVF